MGSIATLQGQRLYLDANLFIYALEAVEPWARPALELLSSIDRGDCTGVTSELTLAECLVKPLQLGRSDLAETYQSVLQPRPHLFVVPVSRKVLVEAAQIRSSTRLKLPDAIHAATALSQGCASYLTNDDRFQAPPNLAVLYWRDLL